jgi:Tol biopolymer transport system component
MKPEVFAPGIISSTDHRELGGGTFSPDGKEYYFTRDIDNDWVIMVSRLESEGWTFPEPVKFSEGFTALEPHITFDNRRIFWASWGRKDTGTYMATRTSDGWSEAEYVGPGMAVSSSRDGQMYVTDTQLRPYRIVNVQIENGRFTQYKRLRGGIEQFQNENWSAHPCISPDGSCIIFDKNGTYMYVSFRNMDNEWRKPIDLTKHGFHPKVGIASISPDGKYLFFGKRDDIYWVSTKIIEELKPEYLR